MVCDPQQLTDFRFSTVRNHLFVSVPWAQANSLRGRLLARGIHATACFDPKTHEAGLEIPDAAQVRKAVARSLPFLEKEGLAWMAQRKCIACHHGPFLLWSHNEARRRGFAVDAKKVAAWTDQALALYLKDEKDHQKKKNGC